MAGSRREIIKAKQRVFEDWGIKWDAAIEQQLQSEIVCGWYDKCNCHDDHITTAAKAALREMGVL